MESFFGFQSQNFPCDPIKLTSSYLIGLAGFWIWLQKSHCRIFWLESESMTSKGISIEDWFKESTWSVSEVKRNCRESWSCWLLLPLNYFKTEDANENLLTLGLMTFGCIWYFHWSVWFWYNNRDSTEFEMISNIC